MIDLERIKRVRSIAIRRFNKAKKWGKAIDRLNYGLAMMTSNCILNNLISGELKITDEEYDELLKDYDWMIEDYYKKKGL